MRKTEEKKDTKRGKKQLALLLAVIVAAMAVVRWLPGNTDEVEAASGSYNVTSVSLMLDAFNNCQDDSDYFVQLASNIEITDDNLSSGQVFQLTKGKLTVDLNGYTIDGSKCSKSGTVFYNNGGNLTIEDSRGGGKIISPKNGVNVRTEAGSLNISGGSFENASQCLSIQNSTVNITGGTFQTNGNGSNDITLMVTGDNSKVTIKDGSFVSNYGTVWVQDAVKTGSSLTIDGGTFTANENGKWSYACYIGGSCDFSISDGTFNLYANNGSSLYLGAAVTDAKANISGGTFNGRIARGVSDSSRQNYTAFYGDENGNDGIITRGCVLTDNTFSYQGNNTVFTPGNVRVLSGSLLTFNTKRSTLEEYGVNETALANTADYYSLSPISVGADGRIYSNTDTNVTPSVDGGRVTDSNTYQFHGWVDEKGNEYNSPNAYIEETGGRIGNNELCAIWDAKTNTSEGLNSAVLNNQVIKDITVTGDILLTSSVVEEQQNLLMNRGMNLDGHTISYAGTNNPAFTLNSAWNIKNGAITSSAQACLQVGGTAIIENVNCIAQNFSYAVRFSNVSTGSQNKIVSGIFEAGAANGHALWTINASQTGAAQDITSLFKDSYASSSDTEVDGANTYLGASKLIVSQTPITYIGDGADIDMGSFSYGEIIPAVNRSISNQEYVGDIIVTGVSVDNPAFKVTGESASKALLGGSTDTYSYTVEAAGNPVPGTHEGIVNVNYTKMDGTSGEYQQKVSMKVSARQLTIEEPALIMTKTYDGTATAGITAGELKGVVNGDDVSIIAVAEYDNAEAGNGKTITVRYTLNGTDKYKYLAPVAGSYNDGVIEKADGTANVTMADYYVGQTVIPTPAVTSYTNGTESVTYFYKQQSAADDTYTATVPATEGSYTVKAVFPANNNYHAVETTADFKVSYIDTPEQPYTLAGTRGSNGWFLTGVAIHPAKGYRISVEENGTYQDYYTVGSTAEPVIYLKNEAGAVTRPIQVEKIQIDTEAPKIAGIANGETYFEDVRKAVITDDNLEHVMLNGEDVSFEGNSATVLLKPSVKKYVVRAEDKAGNAIEYTIRVEEAWMKEGIVSGGIRSLIQGKAYRLGSGQWTVRGDSTVYNGGMNFYVPADGEYDFKKK